MRGRVCRGASGALSTRPSPLLLNKPSWVLTPSPCLRLCLPCLSVCLSLSLCLPLSLFVSLSLSPHLSLPYFSLSVSVSLSISLCLSLSLLVSGFLLPSLLPWLLFGGQAMLSGVPLTAEGPGQEAPPSSVQAGSPLVCVWEESTWGSPPPQPREPSGCSLPAPPL